MTEIVNCKSSRYENLFDEFPKIAYCGLSFEYWGKIYPAILDMTDLSQLGKPKRLIVRGDRPTTIANYRRYLWSVIDRDIIKQALLRIGSGEFDAVACWCVPKLCHCTVILSAAGYVYGKESV